MKSKKIYLIRHGQTDFNLKGIVQGSGVDSSLNALGEAQAAAFYSQYKHLPFEKVYTSALKRSQQSVEAFLADGIPHIALASLNEISWGSREGVAITPEEDAYYHNVIKSWQEGQTHLPIDGGESPDEVFQKQKHALQIIEEGEEDLILICMHGRAMRILLCQILNYPLKCMDLFEHHNLGLYVLNFTGTMYTVEEFNNTSHLSDL